MIIPLPRMQRNDLATLFGLGAIGGLSDEELLARFLAGRGEAASEAAFEILVTRHGPMVLGVCRRILGGDSHAAADAFQATFLILVGKARSIRVEGSLGPWLHGVSRRVALRAKAGVMAERSRSQALQGLDVPERSGTPDPVATNEVKAVIDQEIARLPARYRSAMVLCDLQGLTQEQAAKQLLCPVGTVQSRLHRAREKLKSGLMRRGVAPAALGAAALVAASARAEAVPPSLLTTTVAASARFYAGHALAGAVPDVVARLVKQDARSLSMIKFACGSVGLLAVALGIGVVAAAPGGFGNRAAPKRVVEAAAQPPAIQAPAKPAVSGRSVEAAILNAVGEPVADATVVIGHDLPSKTPHSVIKTDREGRFAWPIPDGAVTVSFIAAKDGLAPVTWQSWISADERPRRANLRMEPAEPVSSVLVDGKGRPIAGAQIQVEMFANSVTQPGGPSDTSVSTSTCYGYVPRNVLAGSPLESAFRATTDRNGAFTFPVVPGAWLKLGAKVNGTHMRITPEKKPDIPLTLRAGLEGFLASWPNEPTRLVASPGAKIAGRVVTSMPGVSVSGLTVSFQGSQAGAKAGVANFNYGVDPVQTDKEGRFTFEGLDEGAVNIFVDGPGEQDRWTYRAGQDVALRVGATAQPTIELIPGVKVEGRVVNRADQPIEGVMVGVYGPYRPKTGAATRSATTDAKGRFHYRLPAGQTYLYVMSSGPHFTTLPSGGSSQDVAIPNAESFAAPAIVVESAVALHGQVVDAKGEPVPGAMIIGINLPDFTAAFRRTLTPLAVANAKGEFQLSGQNSSAAPGKPSSLVIRHADEREFVVQVTPTNDGTVTVKLP